MTVAYAQEAAVPGGPGYRRIQALEWAFPCPAPTFGKEARRSQVQKLGLRYQRTVERALPGAECGPWYRFCDANGLGYCQPDILLRKNGEIWVIEVKLTYTPMADFQLTGLYLPILRHLHREPIHGVIICKHLSPNLGRWRIAEALADVQHRPSLPAPVVHWLGKGPL